MEKEEKPQYISLKQASLISGYHPDYLGYLIRKGKLEGVRIGKSWLTTKEAVLSYLSEAKNNNQRGKKRNFTLKRNNKEVARKLIVGVSLSAILIFAGFLMTQYQNLSSLSSRAVSSQKDNLPETITQTTDQGERIVINIYSQNPLDTIFRLQSTINSFLGENNSVSNSISNLRY